MTLIGRYEIQAEVGRGGMGVVHRALDPQGRTVAVKLLLAGRHASPQQRARVATEIKSLLRIRHPNVVALLDAGEHQGVPYLVTEWVAGETLAGLLERGGPLDPIEAVRLVVQLCGALSHCHARGVLHRDLKPENVLLRGVERHPLLLDFGLSKDVASDSRASIHGTVAGLWLGTPGYWPPEQARGELLSFGPRSDVYGLGAILYAALTGRPPQEGASLMELAQSIDRPPTPPGSLREGIPATVEAACLRALALDPAARPAGPEELARELEAALPGASATRRGRALLALAVSILAAAAASAALALRASPAPEQPAPVASAREGPESLDATLARAAALLASGDAAGALAAWDRAIALAPRSAPTWVARGEVRAQLGRFHEAIADYEQAQTLDPGLATAWLDRGLARVRLGLWREALADYDRAIELDPGLAHAWLARGVVRSELGRPAEALTDLEQALTLTPRDPDVWTNRGIAHARLDRREESLADFTRALEIDPRSVGALANRGVAHASFGRASEALADFDRALELDPTSVLALVNRARVRMNLGRWREAIADLDRAIELEPAGGWAEQARAWRAEAEQRLAGR